MNTERLQRYIILIVGLLFISFGVSFSIRAQLGIIPTLCPSYVISLVTPLSVGQVAICFHLVYVLWQFVLSRDSFSEKIIDQLISGLILGMFIDFANWATRALIYTSYIDQIFFLLLSAILIAIGISLFTAAKLAYIGDLGFVFAISKRLEVSFVNTKIVFNLCLTAFALIFSYYAIGDIKGIREGTVISAFLIGLLAGRMLPFLGSRVEAILRKSDKKKINKDITVITIDREFGSGGHEIGQKVAERLGWEFVDHQLIARVAEYDGVSIDQVVKHDQHMSSIEKIWKDICMDSFLPFDDKLSDKDKVFETQSLIVRNFADIGHCVIVGRCANRILSGRSDCLHIFLMADRGFACNRVTHEFGYSADKALRKIESINEARSTHYTYYTGGVWGSVDEYDWVIKSSDWGIDETVEMIISYASL